MSSSTRQPAIRFVFITLLLDVIGFGLLIPVGPRLVEQLTGKNEVDSAPVYAALAATYALMQFVFAPVLGNLSDRFGRRPVILVSLFGSGIDYIAGALAPNIAFLFLTRAINGVSGANMTACNAYIADITPPEKRAAAFGMVGAAFGIGFILGPALGGALGEIDIRLPFWAAAAMCLTNWLYGWFVLPESLPIERHRAFNWKRANPIGSFAHLTRYPVVSGLAAAQFALNLAMFGLHATWVLYTAHRYGWSSFQTGLSLTVVGIGAAFVQGGLARKIIPALGEPRSLIVGIAIGVLSYFGYALAPQGWMIYVIILFGSLGGIAQPAAQAIVTKSVPPTEQGEVQGALTSLSSIAAILGPMLAGYLFGHFGDKANATIYIPGASFLAGGLLAAAGLALSISALKRLPKSGATAY